MTMPTIERLEERIDVFATLGVRRVVNCCGIYTDLGGSVLSASVWGAVTELNGSFVRMTELLDAAGRMIAPAVGAEAARVTPGASAAIALAVGATMTGCNGSNWERLPDTTGMRNQVVMARSHFDQYKYAVCARMPGARIVPSGPVDVFELEALLSAIRAETACVLIPAHLLDGFSGVEQLSEVVRACHACNVPVVVDAAYMCYPIELMKQYAMCGVDLTCFSAKYFNGPNSGGFVAGRADQIRAVEGLDFTRFESGKYRKFGRAFKMSRYDVAATALALDEWIRLDHAARWRTYAKRVRTLLEALHDRAGLTAQARLFTMSEELVESDSVNCVAIGFSSSSRHTVASVRQALESDDPIIATVPVGETLVVAVDALLEGQERIVASRLSAILSS